MKLALSLTLVLCLGTCERRTIVKLEGGNPPSFILSGSGRLDEVVVFAPEQEPIAKSDPFDDTYAIWDIKPEEEGEYAKALLDNLRAVTYGIVPKGYKQMKPKVGQAPALAEGKRYKYWFVTVNAPWGAGYFEIRDGKVVAVDGP